MQTFIYLNINNVCIIKRLQPKFTCIAETPQTLYATKFLKVLLALLLPQPQTPTYNNSL